MPWSAYFVHVSIYTLHYVPRSESFAFPLGFWAKEEMACFFFFIFMKRRFEYGFHKEIWAGNLFNLFDPAVGILTVQGDNDI